MSNPGEYAPLDKSAQPVIMKIPKAPRQAVLPLIKLQDQVNSKPSLCRVAVSACNADRYGKSKNMERDRHRHIHPPFREAKPPIAVLEPWGSKEPHSVYHIPNKMSNPGECAPLDKSGTAVIMKIAKGSATSGFPLAMRRKDKSSTQETVTWQSGGFCF